MLSPGENLNKCAKARSVCGRIEHSSFSYVSWATTDLPKLAHPSNRSLVTPTDNSTHGWARSVAGGNFPLQTSVSLGKVFAGVYLWVSRDRTYLVAHNDQAVSEQSLRLFRRRRPSTLLRRCTEFIEVDHAEASAGLSPRLAEVAVHATACGKRNLCSLSRSPAFYNFVLGDLGSKCLSPPTLLSFVWRIFPVSHVPLNKAEQCLFHIRTVKSRLGLEAQSERLRHFQTIFYNSIFFWHGGKHY